MGIPFLKELFHWNKPKINPFQLIGAGLCMFTVLFTGYFLENMAIASFGSFGIFVFLYYHHLPLKNLLLRLSAIGLFVFVSFLLGLLSTHVSWLAPLVVSIIAFTGRVFFRLYNITKPGVFFGVMVTAMGTSMHLPLSALPSTALYFLLGIILSFIMAGLVHFTEKTPAEPVTKISISQRLADDPAVVLDGIFYGGMLFFAVYLSQGLQLTNPYWMVVSTAAVLQGDNLRAMLHRNIQRILGTIIGLGLSVFLLNLPLTTVQTLLMITILYVIVEITIRTNYAVANFFITPMFLMLASLIKHQYMIPLLPDRFIGIVLGGILGLFAAWIMTVGLKFYNKAFDLHENLDKEND